MRPFFKYPGSKWQASARYPAPRFEKLIEPFAGSACYATRHYERKVVLNETDPEIVALWRWLTKTSGDEIAKLPFDLPIGLDIRDLELSSGASLLIRQWQRVGRNDCWTVSKWCGANSGFWCESTRDAVAAQAEKIRHWEILNKDAMDLKNQEATWFVDPPYVGRESFYREKFNRHTELANWCRARTGQVIVCERASATWLPFSPSHRQVTGRRGKKSGSKEYSPEGIWTKDPTELI